MDCRKEWKHREESGEMSLLENMQHLGKRKIDESFINTRIEYLSEFDINEDGTQKQLRWYGGIVEQISDDT